MRKRHWPIHDRLADTRDCFATEALWWVCFITYIHFYGIVELFRKFRHDFSPGGPIYTAFMQKVAPKDTPTCPRFPKRRRPRNPRKTHSFDVALIRDSALLTWEHLRPRPPVRLMGPSRQIHP